MRNASIFSFFAGAGFLDLGFEKSGFDVVYVNEFHQPFLDGYQHSRSVLKLPKPKYGYEGISIEEVDAEVLANHQCAERSGGNITGFIGGPPCPDFSIGGKNKGQQGDNGRLSRVYVDLVCKAQPDFFLFENVRGLYRTAKHRSFFEELKSSLREAGYVLHERLVNAIEYGAPQDRDRIILLGFLDDSLPEAFDWGVREYPDRTAFEYEWPTRDDFLEDQNRAKPNSIPVELTVQHWFDRNSVDNHPNAKHFFQPRAGLKKFEVIMEGDDSKKSYKRLHRWRYSPTAAYGNNEVHLHPYKSRRLSVAEALAIQSLPKEFELPPKMTLTNMFKTVGNGVPYLAALGLAKAVKKHLELSDETDSRRSSPSDKQTAA
jgi:DNA (cytosine-5)-methyltransferase 1